MEIKFQLTFLFNTLLFSRFSVIFPHNISNHIFIHTGKYKKI